MIKVMKPCKPRKTANSETKVQEALQDPSPYIAERKLDGCRYLTHNNKIISPRKSRVTGKNVDKTAQVPQFHYLLERFPNAIFDGEICISNKESKAQDVVSIMGCKADKAVSRQEDQPLHYVIFDLLKWNNKSIINKPWYRRRAILENIEDNIQSPYVHLAPVVNENKEQFLQQELDEGREGIVLKHQDKKYIPGKRPAWNWIKIKSELEDDVVILGYEPPEKVYDGKQIDIWPHWEDDVPVTRYYHNDWIGAIRIGKYIQYPDGQIQLECLGTCSGMTDKQRKMFSEHPDKFIGRVAKIKAMELTRDNAYRHPSFIMLHSDKNPEECILVLKEE